MEWAPTGASMNFSPEKNPFGLGAPGDPTPSLIPTKKAMFIGEFQISKGVGNYFRFFKEIYVFVRTKRYIPIYNSFENNSVT